MQDASLVQDGQHSPHYGRYAASHECPPQSAGASTWEILGPTIASPSVLLKNDTPLLSGWFSLSALSVSVLPAAVVPCQVALS